MSISARIQIHIRFLHNELHFFSNTVLRVQLVHLIDNKKLTLGLKFVYIVQYHLICSTVSDNARTQARIRKTLSH
jgi:hypothetical protein